MVVAGTLVEVGGTLVEVAGTIVAVGAPIVTVGERIVVSGVTVGVEVRQPSLTLMTMNKTANQIILLSIVVLSEAILRRY